MPRLLIVSPRFPPINAPDMHRVRQSLPYYHHHGWQVTVLCIDPATARGVYDPMLEQTLPPDVEIVRTHAWPEAICRRFGFGELAYRSLLPLYRAGSALLDRDRYDVVLFSTTVFLCFTLGRLWKRRYGCGVVFDFQDPWYSDDILYTRDTAPGGWWKYRLDRFLARHLERFALKAADHIVCVSPGYVEQLSRRHSRLDLSMFTVLPFGVAAADYAVARKLPVDMPPALPAIRWVSAGRAGSDMDPVLAVLFGVLAEAKSADPTLADRLRLHFVGTNYAPPERTRKLVQPLASACAVGDLVEENSLRVGYFEAISLCAASDAILMIGSTEADYTASKLLTCVASRRPILALFHSRSLVSDIAARFPNVFLATFDRSPGEPQFRARVAVGIDWLLSRPQFDTAAIDAALEPWSAQALTRRQCAIFDRCVRNDAEGQYAR
jgi:hypothetical protein